MDIIRLDPHDPLPEGPARRVVVLRRFDEDSPRATHIEIRLEGGGHMPEITRPANAHGPLDWDAAVEAAIQVARSERLDRITTLDRTAGPREQDILQHAGDHSVHMEALADTDPEDGEAGPDMRDLRI